MVSAPGPPNQLLVRGLMFVTVILACTANHILNDTADEGSALVTVIDDEDDFCVKVVGVTSTAITLYWIEPNIDVNTYVSYYLVSYNATVRYQTMTGERVLTFNYTSDPCDFATAEIPLYNANSTYILQITAVTEDDRVFTSNDVTITEDELHGYISKGQNDTTYFQIGLAVTGSQESFNCASFEDDYGNVLLDIRSQLLKAAQNVCNSIHNDTNLCVAQLPGDQFCCRNNSGLIYVAEVVGTMQTSAATFLESLRMLGPLEISLLDQTFSVVSSSSCPLSIPSAREVNCSLESTAATTNTEADTTSSAPVTTSTAITTTATTATSGGQDENSTVIVITTIACLVGIVVITLSIIGVLVILHHCRRCHNHSNSMDVEKDLFTVKPYSLITNTRSNSRAQLTDQERQWNQPAQSLILPSFPDSLLYDQHCNGHADRNTLEHADRNTLEHHITTDH